MTEKERLNKFVADLPNVNISRNTKIEDLEKLENGVYSINQCLPITLIKQLPYFNESLGEVGLILVDGNWLLIISNYSGIGLPFLLYKYLTNGAVQFCAHSHPYTGKFENTSIPSITDLFSKDIEGYTYIISKEGFSEINVSSLSLKTLEFLQEKEQLFNGRIDPNAYLMFMKELYDNVGLKYRIIDYGDQNSIYDIILRKEKVKTNYWLEDIDKHATQFPGPKK